MKLYHSKSDIWYYLLLYIEIIAISLYGDILPSELAFSKSVLDLFAYVDRSAFLYAFTWVLLFVVLAWLLDKQRRSKIFRISHCLFYAMTTVLLFLSAQKHDLIMEYLGLLWAYFVCAFVFELLKIDGAAHKNAAVNNGVDGFVVDCSKQDDLQNVGWKEYAENLLSRLAATNTNETSFAVALTGSWGTGKTTFLSLLKSAMNDRKFVYMEFNPWMSSSVEMIIRDFFIALNSKLKQMGVKLEDEIDDYVKMLFNWNNGNLSNKMKEAFHLSDDQDIATLRGKISEGLNLLDGNLYILIDDIDRLQKEEIFEVLKLIRNTADFNHIVYVVTFDKEYVASSLKELGIVRNDEYLKKIFQVELKFPMFEQYLLTHLFKEKLQAHTHYQEELQKQLNKLEYILSKADVVIYEYISNFRDVKRLVNEFILNLDYISKQEVIADFDIKDLFLIHLLEFVDEKSYKIFRQNLWDILSQYPTNRKYLELAMDDKQLIDKGLSKQAIKLIKILFPVFKSNDLLPKRNSIRREDRVLNYFSFRPYAYQMSLTDFQRLMKSSSEEAIKSYVQESNVGVFSKSSSIYSMLYEQKLVGLDDKTIKSFMVLLAEWTKKYHGSDYGKVGDLFRLVLSVSNVEDNKRPMVKKLLISLFTELQDNVDKGIYVLQKIYCKMIPCIADVDENGELELYPECIYSKDELLKLIGKNCKSFLDRVRPSVSQILDLHSRIHEFIQISIVYNEAHMSISKQFEVLPIVNELILYFAQNKERNDIRLFEDKFDIDNYYDESDYSRESCFRDDIIKYFGSVDFYKRFLQECFTHTEENDLETYFRNNQL